MSEAKGLEQAIGYWNAGDRDAWATLYAEDVVYEAPGGQQISGLTDLKEKYFDALADAAPDRSSRDIVLFSDGEDVVEQARYVGTHTGPLRSPNGVEVPPTGKLFDFPLSNLPRPGRQDPLYPHLLRPDGTSHAAGTDAWSHLYLALTPAGNKVMRRERPRLGQR